MATRIGTGLIILGAAIFIYQLATLLSNQAASAERRAVLTGSIDQMAGQRELRPALSVIGVAFVAGGIFVLALSGGKKP